MKEKSITTFRWFKIVKLTLIIIYSTKRVRIFELHLSSPLRTCSASRSTSAFREVYDASLPFICQPLPSMYSIQQLSMPSAIFASIIRDVVEAMPISRGVGKVWSQKEGGQAICRHTNQHLPETCRERR
jgi:hypothetical protein